MRALTVAGDPRYRTVDDDYIIGKLLLDGWAFDVRGPARDNAEVEARRLLDRLVGLGLPYRRAVSGKRLFDPVETSNFLRWAHLAHGDPALEQRCALNASRMVSEAHGGQGDLGAPPSLEALGPGRYAVTILRTFNARGRQPGGRVRLRLPLPIEDEWLETLQIELLDPDGLCVQHRSSPARLDVVATVPPEGRVTIGLRATFVARVRTPVATTATLPETEAELYRRASDGLIKVDGRVQTLAADLAVGATDTLATVERFWRFLIDDLACGSVHYDQIDPVRPLDGVLDRGWYDCKLGSALLVAMCRARGIPARLVGGYLIHSAAPSIHTWAEVWIDGFGWLPFDLFSWDFAPPGKAPDWRNYYFGRLDHRMTVERPPYLFGGTGDIRLPSSWQMVAAPNGRGSVMDFLSLATGDLIYRESIESVRLTGPSDPSAEDRW